MKTKKTKSESILMRLIDGDRQKHKVALVTDEGEWNQHEPNTGMARMFVVMLLIHVVLIGGIIIYDFMGEEESPAQAVTLAARASSTQASTGLPQASEEVLNAQANAVANPEENTETYTVVSGDSIPSIAEKHGTSKEVIIQMNRLDKGIQIEPGMLLNVPKGSTVPTAIGISREEAEKLASRDQPPAPPSETVNAQDAPASIGATTSAIPLVAPGEPAVVNASLLSAAETPATTTVKELETFEVIGGVPNPEAVASLVKAGEENEKAMALVAKESPPEPAEEQPKPTVRSEPKPEVKKVEKTEPRLVRPNPVPTPSQMSKRIADAPPAPKKSVTKSTTKSTPKSPTKTSSKSSSKTHTLASGETLYRLSTKYGVSVAALQKANNIKNPNSMRLGMKLVIPGK